MRARLSQYIEYVQSPEVDADHGVATGSRRPSLLSNATSSSWWSSAVSPPSVAGDRRDSVFTSSTLSQGYEVLRSSEYSRPVGATASLSSASEISAGVPDGSSSMFVNQASW